MEFPFDVNILLPSVVTVIDHDLARWLPDPSQPSPKKLDWDLTENLKLLIDSMGEASAVAQNLSAAITTCLRLQQSEERIYVMKDPQGNNGLGSVVGILKVGRRKLFVVDREGRHCETYPLCVLDFYVHESRQRRGCGHQLFQCMLEREDVKPHHLAIDRPSSNLISFMQKHYGLKDSIPQPYNFLVFSGFLTGHMGKWDETSPLKSTASGSRSVTISQSAPCGYPGMPSRLHHLSRGNVLHRSHPLALDSLRRLSGSSLARCSPETTTSWKLFGVPPPAYRLFASPSRRDQQ